MRFEFLIAGPCAAESERQLMDTAAQQLGVFGPTEILCSYDTYQFSNYDRYDAATFSEAHKAEVRNTQFPIDLEKAYELGKRLVVKCTEV